MAKKKSNRTSGQKPQKPQKWLESESITLLAWLDFTLRHPEINFRSTVTGHLGDKFTYEKVERKLRLLWDRKGPDGPRTTKAKELEHIYAHGSGSFDCLSLDWKQRIADEIDQLESEFRTTRLVATLTPSRRLRSASNFDTKTADASASPSTVYNGYEEQSREKKPIFEFASRSTPKTKKATLRVRETFSTPLKNSRKRKRTDATEEDQNEITDGPPSPRIKPLQTDITAASKSQRTSQSRRPSCASDFSSLTSIQDSEESVKDFQISARLTRSQSRTDTKVEQHHPSPNPFHTQQDGRDETIRCVCGKMEEPEGGDKGWIECDECKVWQHASCVKYFCERCDTISTRNQADANTQTVATPIHPIHDAYRDERLVGAMGEIEILRNRLLEKDDKAQAQKNELERLRRKVSAMVVAQTARDNESNSALEERITMLLQEKDELQRALHARDKLVALTNLSKSSQDSCHYDLPKGLDEVYYHRNCFLGTMDEQKMFPALPLDQYPDLRDLVNSTVGASPSPDTVTQVKLRSNLFHASSQAILKALITSALREWVFHEVFPCFDGDESHTLRGYREHISELGGPTVLRNLDLATITALVREGNFQNNTIPLEATRLANRLSVALAPLFEEIPIVPVQLAWDGFATWQSSPVDVKNRRDHLTDMFACALKAKAESCLNIEWYEMPIYPPGTKFDPKTMEVQTVEGMIDTVRDHKNREVDICVQAALFAHPREDLSDGDDTSACLMSARNFKTQQKRGDVLSAVVTWTLLMWEQEQVENDTGLVLEGS
ncbi:uncharacterized protein PAC_16679 [Phialocephala subalpina]|uniref:Zinc finger PHD-type domain-containing protein n=1 Tax=Phialocephala subalpina TaxID=576137 RepID=A0A1L7XP28_9HELO|nr:uncharacterized protein PAC_16679 [Phialocephala subalpina]